MQAITTKYFGPSNVRGSRIKATSGSGLSVTISCPDELNMDAAHKSAAQALCDKLKWNGKLIGGGLKDGGYAFVFDGGLQDTPTEQGKLSTGDWRILERENCLGTHTVFHGQGERADNQVCQCKNLNDARLIASAPDLLAACEDSLALLVSLYGDDGCGNIQELKNVIAKAKGQP